MNKSPIESSRYSILIQLAAFVIVISGVIFAQSLVNSILLSFFIAINLSSPISWLRRKKVPKPIATGLMLLLVVLSIYLLGGVFTSSFSSFSEQWPKYEGNLNKLSSSVIETLSNYGIDVEDGSLLEAKDASKIIKQITGYLSDFGSVIGNSFTIFFLTIFLLFELDTVPLKIKAIAQLNKSSFTYFNSIGNSIRHYLTIKTITSLLTGILIWIALIIIGVDHAIIWAIIAFLLNYIPNIGSIIAAIPAVLFAGLQLGAEGLIWTAIIFFLANTIIGNIVEPKMMGNGLGLSTFIVFLSLIFWGLVLGTVGMFLSVPLTMAFKIGFEQNPRNKWASILLGTEDDARKALGEVEGNED